MTARYRVDTDWAIHCRNGHPHVIEQLNACKIEGLALSVLSLGGAL